MHKPIAVVTGGVRGIGKATVQRLVANGYFVFATCRELRDDTKRVEEEHPGDVSVAIVDGADWEQVCRFRDRVLALGAPAIIINNAGVTADGLFIEKLMTDVHSVFQSNVYSVLHYTSAFLPSLLRARQGDIVNISSAAAVKPKVGNALYGMTKAAVERFTQGIALEVARFNVRANCVAPGFVNTEMFRKFEGGSSSNIARELPGRRVLSPEEVATVVCDLALRRTSTHGTIVRIGNGENI